MNTVHGITKSNGAISYWREGEEEFTVTRNANGLPESIQSTKGRWPSQSCTFNYDVLGSFTGMSGNIDTAMLPRILNEATGIVSASTVGGVTSLLGPDGEAFPLQKYSVVMLSLAANTAALANNTVIPFDTINQDDIGLTTLNWATNKTRLYYPQTAKFVRVSYRVGYEYVGASPTGTYRGIRTYNYNEGGASGVLGLDVQITVPPLVIGTASEAAVSAVSARVNVEGSALDDDNWIQLHTQHNASASTVIKGSVAPQLASWAMLEVWE